MFPCGTEQQSTGLKTCATFYTQIKLTHRYTEATVGWQGFCRGHDKPDDAMICHDKLAADLKKPDVIQKRGFTDHRIELRIMKVTEEIVEDAQEICP